MRTRYWSCTKFADFVRGTKKPSSGTLEEWDEWESNARNTNKFRYWLAEEFLDRLQSIINFPSNTIHSFKYWIIKRFVRKTHALTSSTLKRGEYHEFDERILYCLFDELVNFVEVEKAWMQVVCNDEKYKRPSFIKRLTWRNANAGIEYLQWESSLTNKDWIDESETPEYTNQAIVAQETLELYYWWKFTRRNRADPYEASGWSELYENKTRTDFNRRSKEEKQKTKEALKKLDEIESSYDNEDEEMLIRLIKIRKSLWT